MVKVAPLVLDMPVGAGKLLDSLPASIAGSFPPGNFSLQTAKLSLCGLVIPGIFDCSPVTQDGKARNAHINTSHCAGWWERRRGFNLHAETDIPLPTRLRQGHCFDL